MLKNLLKRFSKSTEGATAIEYGLIAAGIAIVVAAGIALISPQLTTTFNAIAAALTPGGG
jgi:pilus assembly protein Flp/PilA|tara:strand:+ start:5278 stop:5457 length:180 start_codon:yes stop_codon:yes gene_type:complete